MISGAQIRAARGLLGISSTQLAERCDLTRKSIEDIERGDTSPRETTIKSITRALHEDGIEFMENDGVKRRTEGVQVFRGTGGFAQFYDIVYDHLLQHGGEVCISGVDESLFAKYQKNQNEYITKVSKLEKERGDIKAFILIKEGDQNFVASNYAEYRWQDKKSFSPTAFYVFGDNLALISFQSENPPHVVLINSAAFAAAYRKQFKDDFAQAKIPSKKKGEK
ncbi:MAG: helix-turn-helix transcriptional regulator [Alphaproteobacteria bacterium]